jgi:hypothetical protein
MRIKLVSFVLVTIGLFLCTIEDGPPSAAAPKTSLTPAAGSLTHLPGLGEDDESGGTGGITPGAWGHGPAPLSVVGRALSAALGLNADL